MPLQRKRHALSFIKKAASYSPSVGVIGLRQVGKTTLLVNQLDIDSIYSLDDSALRDEAQSSAKTFLSKLTLPCVLDEVQKAPELFDAIKLRIDRKRIPGLFYLTGSTEFSAKIGIRESLTGRIAQLQLYPMTLAEAHQQPWEAKRGESPIHLQKTRFRVEQASETFLKGGLPVPLFMRDKNSRTLYFDQWIDTALLRDLARVYGRGYDPDLARDILDRIGWVLREGETPSLKHFKIESRKLKRYLTAMESIFLLRRIPCHEAGTGLPRWMVGDVGLASSIMKFQHGEAVTLSQARHFILNEISAQSQYAAHSYHARYYKSAQAKEAVDFIWNGVPMKVLHAPPSQVSLGWIEQSLLGAMKKLNAKIGLLIAPVDHADVPKKGGIGIVPWTYWS